MENKKLKDHKTIVAGFEEIPKQDKLVEIIAKAFGWDKGEVNISCPKCGSELKRRKQGKDGKFDMLICDVCKYNYHLNGNTNDEC